MTFRSWLLRVLFNDVVREWGGMRSPGKVVSPDLVRDLPIERDGLSCLGEFALGPWRETPFLIRLGWRALLQRREYAARSWSEEMRRPSARRAPSIVRKDVMLGQDNPLARIAVSFWRCCDRTRSNRIRVSPSLRSRVNCRAQALISFLVIPRNVEVNIFSNQKEIEAIRNKSKRFRMLRLVSESCDHTCASLPDALG